MMKRYLLLATPIAAVSLLTGCIDDNYDLSNIDKTTEVNVNGLTIPVNLDEVKLDALIDLDEDSDIKEEIDANGKKIYVYSYPNKSDVDNTFESDDIEVNPFDVTPSPIDPTYVKVKLDQQVANVRKAAPATSLSYTVEEESADFKFTATGIDSSVTRISKLGTPSDKDNLVFHINLHFDNALVNATDKIFIKKLDIRFPEGLNATTSLGTFANDIVTITDTEVVGGKLELVVTSDQLAVNQIVTSDSFTYENAITVLGGGKFELDFKTNSQPVDEFTVTTDYNLEDFKVTVFSGGINYILDGFDIDPINLDDMPSFLTEEGTDLKLANPQLYLSVTNPVSNYGLEPFTNMAFIQVRNGIPMDDEPMILPNGLTIKDNMPAGYEYKYALSPEGKDLVIPTTGPAAEFNTPETVKLPYPALSDVLSGSGLPEALNVKFSDTKIENDNVNDFKLGEKIKGVHGKYVFRAPLALAEGSKIMKSGTETDWSSEDLDRLSLSEIALTALVSSDLPVGVQISAKVIDTDGNYVGKSNTVVIPAMADNYEMVIRITPEDERQYITKINGIFYDAICVVNENDPAAGQPLSPDQNLILKNVRAKVTGKYVYTDDKN